MFADRRAAAIALAIGAGALGLTASAHVRIKHPSTGSGLFWPGASSTGIVFNAAGSADIPDDSDEVAVRNAIQSWNAVDGAGFTLIEDVSDAAQARTDWESDSLHLMIFDEDGSSGYFPGSSGVVALTPLWFYSNGSIADADILFNGKDFLFTTSGQPGRFDVQDVATHELGHFLGLDHSGAAGATMFPYVDPAVILHRSLSLDDRNGLRSVYPAGSFARLSGRVERANGSGVARAHVVALDTDGRVAGAALADGDGDFLLDGLDAGTYSVYADPLDAPVGAANLTGTYQVDVDFMTTGYLADSSVELGQTVSLGTLVVDSDVSLQLGRSSDRLPRRGTIGSTTMHTLRGSGLVAGSTLEPSDPDLTVSSVTWLGTLVTFQLTVPAGEQPGHVDLIVTNPSGEQDRLVAAVELTPPDPSVASVAPAVASLGGGVNVTVLGSGFRPGARVVLGDRVYIDGEPGGATVLDSGTITFMTQPTVGGLHDLVVIDPTGVEGRRVDAVQVTDLPRPESVFPPSGGTGGGTPITITGSEFVPGAEVYLGGVAAIDVVVVDSTRIDAVTPASLGAGQVSLQVVNPGGLSGDGVTFTYAAFADPNLLDLEPASGDADGGEMVTIRGAGFGPESQVVFGVDPSDGSGGAFATSVTWIDETTLEVLTPPGGGLVSVMVSNPSTGQADVLEAAYTYEAVADSGGGGCAGIATPGPGSWRDALMGSSWFVALFAVGWARLLMARARRRTLAS
jgi:hypothetical protein